jgi:hypothetical protein
MALIVLASLT